jgi:8-oxo-dGTP diphosphatase
MSNFLVVVECAIKHNDKYLIIIRPNGVHAGGLPSLPGGKVDYADGEHNNDILTTAVKREVYEELGLELIDPVKFVTSSFFIDSVTQNKVLDAIFICELKNTIINITPSPREVPEYHWLSIDEIAKHPKAQPWLLQYLEAANNKFTT